MDESKYQTIIENLTPSNHLDEYIVRRVYAQVFRADFASPGAALLSFRERISSHSLRCVMWSLKNALSALHQKVTGKHLIYLSMGRFDSQTTTKFHLDGAPEEAFLMLGYEATPVISEISIADYSHAAHDWKITPQELLADFNPMFLDNEKRLLAYSTKLSAFNPAHSHILLLNNSSLPYSESNRNMLGVMHQATIIPNCQAQRVINSTMISTATSLEKEPMNADVQKQFLETNEISGSLVSG